jgi:Overcoming lysogenization defect protein-like, TOPRIM domain
MAVVFVEGVTDRIALQAVARRLDLSLEDVEIVAIGGAQAIRRAAADYDGQRVAGLCDAGEERFFRRVLGEATHVCVQDLEDELIRALGPDRVQEVVAAQGELGTFRNFQQQLAWRGRPVDAQLRRWLQASDGRNKRYPPLLVAVLEPDEIPVPLAGVLVGAA